MSVINTMLKDLEQREGQTLSGRYQPPQPSRWRLALIAWLLALLCVPALAYGVWHLWLDQPASVPAPTVEVAVASPVVATPVANAVESAPSHAVVTAQPVAPTVAVTSAQQTAAPVVQPATTAVASAAVAVSPQHQVASVAGVASVTETSLPAQETRAPAPGASASQENGLEETLLGPDEGPQLTEAALHDAFGYVSQIFGQMDETLTHRANNAINELVRQKLLSRFNADPVEGESLYRLTRLAMGIVEFFAEQKEVSSVKLSLLLEQVASELAKAYQAANENDALDHWDEQVYPRLKYSVDEILSRIDLTQRAMDEHQNQV